MKKQEAARVLKHIRKNWFNVYAPLNDCMFDQEVTVGEKFDEALKVLLSRKKKRKNTVPLKEYFDKPAKEDVKD